MDLPRGAFMHTLYALLNLVESWIATHISCNMMTIGHGQSFRVIGPFFLAWGPTHFCDHIFTFLVKFGQIVLMIKKL